MHRRHGQNLFVDSSGFTHGHENSNSIVHARSQSIMKRRAGGGVEAEAVDMSAREKEERKGARPSRRSAWAAKYRSAASVSACMYCGGGVGCERRAWREGGGARLLLRGRAILASVLKVQQAERGLWRLGPVQYELCERRWQCVRH